MFLRLFKRSSANAELSQEITSALSLPFSLSLSLPLPLPLPLSLQLQVLPKVKQILSQFWSKKILSLVLPICLPANLCSNAVLSFAWSLDLCYALGSWQMSRCLSYPIYWAIGERKTMENWGKCPRHILHKQLQFLCSILFSSLFSFLLFSVFAIGHLSGASLV